MGAMRGKKRRFHSKKLTGDPTGLLVCKESLAGFIVIGYLSDMGTLCNL